MEELKSYGIVPIDYATIVSHLGRYKSPRDKVGRLEDSGYLIRLKKGLYVLSPEVSGQSLSVELISNHLYGPSYISFESALSFHGVIPEQTYLVKSATIKRSKSFHTPLGEFEYISVPESYFAIGIEQHIIQNSYAFLMAGPEKALCDLILSTPGLRFQSLKALSAYLSDDLRIDLSGGVRLDPEIVSDCSDKGYKKAELFLLYKLLKNG